MYINTIKHFKPEINEAMNKVIKELYEWDDKITEFKEYVNHKHFINGEMIEFSNNQKKVILELMYIAYKTNNTK